MSHDIYATKGVEYLITLGYLLLLVWFWRYLGRTQPSPRTATLLRDRVVGWFAIPRNLFFDRGHSWLAPRRGGVVRLGLDDFANKLIGTADALDLPAVGDTLEAGKPGWSLLVHGRNVDFRSPVSGKVVAVNDGIAAAPHLAVDDPYGEGWLIEVKVPRRRAALRTMLRGGAARAWLDRAALRLQDRLDGGLGVVLQDGGVPVPGMARRLDHDRWHEIVAELLHP